MQADLRELIAKKDKMEQEIKHLNHKCEAIDKEKCKLVCHVAFSKNLVDAEGFPRPDLDFGELADYRNTKRRLNELNNDHLLLMKEIEGKLYVLHQQKRNDPNFKAVLEAQGEEQGESKPHVESESKPSNFVAKPEHEAKKKPYEIEYLTPFARISTVEQHSPAYVGGLRSGDLLSQFASINIYTPDSIKQIPHVVVENKPVSIAILREVIEGSAHDKVHPISGKNYVKHVFEVKPEKWFGRGLLGCKIDPIQ